MTKPIAYTIPEATRVSGFSRTSVYAELKAGRLAAVKHGKRTLVLAESLEKRVAELPAYEPKQREESEPPVA